MLKPILFTVKADTVFALKSSETHYRTEHSYVRCFVPKLLLADPFFSVKVVGLNTSDTLFLIRYVLVHTSIIDLLGSGKLQNF